MITEEKLLQKVGYCATTLRIYLCRAEFSHVERVKLAPNKFAYKGVTETDLVKLKAFKTRKRASMDGINWIKQRRVR